MFVRDELAQLVASIRYEALPPAVVHASKRVLLDTLACALRATRSAPAAVARDFAHQLGGNAESTVIGTRSRSSCALATFVNGTLIRYLDNNDYYFGHDSAHPSGNLAPALAVGEKAKRAGADVIAALVAAYELQLRLCDLVAAGGISGGGWHPGTDMQFSSAAVAASLMTDDRQIIANALSIAGSHNNTLAQSQRGHIPSMKATAEATIAKGGVEAALLAAAGLTGPQEIFEGSAGWGKIVARGLDFAALCAPVTERYRMLDTCLKPYAAVAGAIGPIQAAIDLKREHRLTSGAIASVTVKLHAYAAKKAGGDAAKLFPADKETADHSYQYCVAVALLDGACGEAQFTDARIQSSEVRNLIARTQLESDAELTKLFPQSSGGGVKVTTSDGGQFEKTYAYPPGHPRNPLSDAQIERKLKELADGILTPAAVQQVIDEVWKFERCSDIGAFVQLTEAI